jgi:hypothetical protein
MILLVFILINEGVIIIVLVLVFVHENITDM